MCDSLQSHGLQHTRLLCSWDYPGKNTRVGGHALLQGIFPNLESNPCLLCLLHCKQILYPLSHLGSFLKSCHSFHCWVWFQKCPKIMGYQGHLTLFYLFCGGGGVHHTVCGILVSWPRVKPQPPALEAQSFFTTRPPGKSHEHLYSLYLQVHKKPWRACEIPPCLLGSQFLTPCSQQCDCKFTLFCYKWYVC